MSIQAGFPFADTASNIHSRPQAPAPLPSACAPDAAFEDKVELAISSLVGQMQQGRHLVVATSMGKDSSVLCAITVLAIERAAARGIRVPHVCFAHSATGYDNPVVDSYADKELAVLKAYLADKALPASVAVQRPTLTNDYVVNMMGGRMIATMPGTDRSCATMLKVSTSRQLKKRLNHLLPGEVVNVVGKRWDESAWRQTNMREAGERPDQAVPVNGELLLSPIAHFTMDDLWTYIAMVRNADVLADAAPFKTYSSFEAMLQVYRDANGGECEINAFAYGKPNRTSCGARTGCHVCTMVNTDTSLENMLQEYPFLKPLLDIRAWILENHYDPANRRWLGRDPDRNGDLSIEPNAYSPEFCRQLLRFYLTAQVEELEAAQQEGRTPAFEVIDERKLIATQALWSRYGYNEPWAALKDWHEIYSGQKRYRPELTGTPYDRKDFPRPESIKLPLTMFTGNDARQLQDPAQMMTGNCQPGDDRDPIKVPLNSRGEFDVDAEGAEQFVWIAGPDILREEWRHDQRPSSVIRSLLNYGVLSIRANDRGRWEQMMTIADTLNWSQLDKQIADPQALKAIVRDAARYGRLEAPHIYRDISEPVTGHEHGPGL